MQINQKRGKKGDRSRESKRREGSEKRQASIHVGCSCYSSKTGRYRNPLETKPLLRTAKSKLQREVFHLLN